MLSLGMLYKHVTLILPSIHPSDKNLHWVTPFLAAASGAVGQFVPFPLCILALVVLMELLIDQVVDPALTKRNLDSPLSFSYIGRPLLHLPSINLPKTYLIACIFRNMENIPVIAERRSLLHHHCSLPSHIHCRADGGELSSLQGKRRITFPLCSVVKEPLISWWEGAVVIAVEIAAGGSYFRANNP